MNTDHRRYTTPVMDSARWERVRLRAGDIVVATPYKAGTTWTQMLCALVVHGAPPFPSPLPLLSTWVDRTLVPVDEMAARFDAQPSPRILKTHTPKDGLPDLTAARVVVCGRDPRDVFFSMRFLLQRPLLKAILNETPTVLLIDEIDRADAEFEAFLLEVLSDFQVSVPELGTLQAVHRPLVFLTSNNTRELSEALKRRCLYLFIGYPAVEQELAVVRLKIPELAPKLAQQAVELVHRLRTLDLRKSPSISETLDWAKSLVALNAKQLDRTTLDNTLSVLLKHESDLQKVRRRIQVNERGAQLDDDDVRPSQRWRN